MAFTRMLNRDRAIRRMSAIPKDVQARVLGQQMLNGGELVVAQRKAAPKRTQLLEGTIQYEDISDETRLRVEVRAGGPETTKPVREGFDGSYDYALADEFGTTEVDAQPFFFPPYRARRSRFKRSLKVAALTGVDKAIAKS